ncbi:unnamed protein product [Acanthoscelides obtectus]|uniref:Uncharacterized protein n=1 Tax=Acanthoscelides obtectus TaxID=200917 RepID=A0A9P0MK20_ACAOB|nr:unnamed protein product [Acanthoscelides obtectus]CAK1682224.1 hypothetical protein AOBTE_LOCUS33497 [Acanthoscelides obtectus]
MSAATIYGLGDEGCAQMMCKRCKHVFCWTTSFCGTTTAARAKTSSVTPAPPFSAPCIACSRCRLCNADGSSSRLSEDDDNEGAERRNSMVGARRRSQEDTPTRGR